MNGREKGDAYNLQTKGKSTKGEKESWETKEATKPSRSQCIGRGTTFIDAPSYPRSFLWWVNRNSRMGASFCGGTLFGRFKGKTKPTHFEGTPIWKRTRIPRAVLMGGLMILSQKVVEIRAVTHVHRLTKAHSPAMHLAALGPDQSGRGRYGERNPKRKPCASLRLVDPVTKAN